jgi:hypothetical protein
VSLDTSFLGLIAAATTVMAVIQIVAVVYAARAAREATLAAQQMQRDLAPILANARKATDDAARITALALTQVERVDEFVSTTSARVDEAMSVIHDVIVGPVRQGSALLAGVRAALEFFASRQARRHGTDDEDESLFIG